MNSHKRGNNEAVREENELKVSLMFSNVTLAEHILRDAQTHRCNSRALSLSNNLIINCISLLSTAN